MGLLIQDVVTGVLYPAPLAYAACGFAPMPASPPPCDCDHGIVWARDDLGRDVALPCLKCDAGRKMDSAADCAVWDADVLAPAEQTGHMPECAPPEPSKMILAVIPVHPLTPDEQEIRQLQRIMRWPMYRWGDDELALMRKHGIDPDELAAKKSGGLELAHAYDKSKMWHGRYGGRRHTANG